MPSGYVIAEDLKAGVRRLCGVSEEPTGEAARRGGAVNRAIGWFARNPVAANLLMVVIMAAGLVSATQVKREVFPEFSLDIITVTVPYLGAAPEEVEEGVCVRVEEAIQGLDGIKRVTSTADEGVGTVVVELELGADRRKVLDDVKSRVDAIDTFPEETEKPIIQELTNRQDVINLAVWGDADEATLKRLGQRVRDELAAQPGNLPGGAHQRAALRDLDRGLGERAAASRPELRRRGPRGAAVVAGPARRVGQDRGRGDPAAHQGAGLPGPGVRGPGAPLPRRTGPTCAWATWRPSWTASPTPTRARGSTASPRSCSRSSAPATRAPWRSGAGSRPTPRRPGPGCRRARNLSYWGDSTQTLQDRLDLLARNGRNGFILVVAVLALFLRFRLAFWVSLGIPISFLGAVWLMPTLDVTLNLITMFAFIVVLGIVVDDAIIVGENVYSHYQRHGDPLKAAIDGAREVSVPVVFAVLTTVAAFLPLLAVEGGIGKTMRVIPLIVIPALLFSLIESLWILPAHLSHVGRREKAARDGIWLRFQGRVAGALDAFVQKTYRPSLELGLRWRYLTAAARRRHPPADGGPRRGGLGAVHLLPRGGGRLHRRGPDHAPGHPGGGDRGRPSPSSSAAPRRCAERPRSDPGHDLFRHAVTILGKQPVSAGVGNSHFAADLSAGGAHLGEVFVELVPAEERGASSAALAQRWRELTAPIPDAVEMSISSSIFRPGEDVNVQLTGPDIDELRAAARELKARLAEYPGVHEIADSFREGKREVQLNIKPEAEVLGLTLVDLGRQVRQGFYGEEAQRIQRGRDDIRVMVRYPKDERRSLGDMESMRIRTPDGHEVPFSQVATVEPGARVRLDQAGGPAPGGERHRQRGRHDRDPGRDQRRPRRAGPAGDPGRPPRGPVLPRGLEVGGARHDRRAAAGLRPGPADDLRPPGHPPALVLPAAGHHVRHPLRPRRRGLGPPAHGHGHDDPLDVRDRGPGRGGGERQPGPGRLHQPPPAGAIPSRSRSARPGSRASGRSS